MNGRLAGQMVGWWVGDREVGRLVSQLNRWLISIDKAASACLTHSGPLTRNSDLTLQALQQFDI